MQEDFANGEYVGYGLDLSKANMASMYFAGMVGIGAKYQFKAWGNTFFFGVDASYELGFTDTYGGKEKDGKAEVNTN